MDAPFRQCFCSLRLGVEANEYSDTHIVKSSSRGRMMPGKKPRKSSTTQTVDVNPELRFKPLNKKSFTPMYFQIEEQLLKLISSGQLRPGDLLPSGPSRIEKQRACLPVQGARNICHPAEGGKRYYPSCRIYSRDAGTWPEGNLARTGNRDHSGDSGDSDQTCRRSWNAYI